MTYAFFVRNTVLSLISGALLFAAHAQAEEAAQPTKNAFMAAGKVGGIVPFSKLGAHVEGALELGYAFGPGRTFVGYLDVSYAVPRSDGTAVDKRVPGGRYSFDVWQKQLVFQPSFAYRFTQLSSHLTPYVGVGPRIYLLETVTEGKADGEDFGTTKERSTKLGFGIPVGVELKLGPGGILAELAFQWAPLNHRITGDTNLGSATLFLGYRAMF